MSTMRDCKEVFGYIESKQDILGKVCKFTASIRFWLLLLSCDWRIIEDLDLWTGDFYIIVKASGWLFAARAVWEREACDVKDLQSTSS